MVHRPRKILLEAKPVQIHQSTPGHALSLFVGDLDSPMKGHLNKFDLADEMNSA